MDRFRQMGCFLRVSRTGSFTAVADQFGHSPAVIARHINEREIGIKITGDFAADSALMLRKAVLAGRGVAILPMFCVRDDLQSGALVEVMPKYRVPPHPLMLLYREKRLLPSRMGLFIEYMRDWFQSYTLTS